MGFIIDKWRSKHTKLHQTASTILAGYDFASNLHLNPELAMNSFLLSVYITSPSTSHFTFLRMLPHSLLHQNCKQQKATLGNPRKQKQFVKKR